jgi:hemerythrin
MAKYENDNTGGAMAFFVWTDKYSVGIQQIDDQHKRLVELVNDLYEAMTAGRGSEVLGTVFNNLLVYTRTHFAEEETLMQQCGFPGFSEHKQLHERLTQQVIDLGEQFRDGRNSLTVPVATFLKDWLVKHIQGTDKKYVPFLKS